MKANLKNGSTLVAACAGMFAASVLLASLGIAATHDKWVDLPIWLAAVSTTFGLVMAGLAAQSASQTLQVERDRDFARDERTRREQAAQVAAWCPRLRLDVVRADRTLGLYPEGGMPVLKAANRSGLPVTNIQYAFELKVFAEAGTTCHLGPVVGRSILEPDDGAVEIVLTSDEWNSIAALFMSVDGLNPLEEEMWVLTVGIAFTDSAGQHWIREQNGRLMPAPEVVAATRQRSAI